jgi:uncharacterized protein (DUF58 family)
MLRPPRRFPPTREGWWFLGATLLVGVAAINGGINLLFMIFGMMLSLILASGVLSELCLRNLEVKRRLPSTIHAGTPFLMGIAVKNEKKKIPTFSLEVEDLPAGRMQETAYKHTLPRRGRHRFTGFRISTRFPFGFIRKSRDIEAPADVLVYPALVPVPETLIRAGLAEAGRNQTPSRSRSGDFHGLREFRTGDDPRDVHWRTSARRGRFFVRECEEETGRTVLLVLENARRPAEGESAADAARAFEAAVSLTASVALALIKKGLLVGLRTADAYVAPASGPGQAPDILEPLALIQPRPQESGARLNVAGDTTILRIVPASPSPRIEVEARAAAKRTA